MVKGKPWSVDEEKQLRQMLQAGKSVRVIAKVLGKTRDCVRMKAVRLGLEVVVQAEKNTRTTTTSGDVLPPLKGVGIPACLC
jgi:histone H3/H4